MAGRKPSGPRCVALVGPYLSGKTSLLESLLAACGVHAQYASDLGKLAKQSPLNDDEGLVLQAWGRDGLKEGVSDRKPTVNVLTVGFVFVQLSYFRFSPNGNPCQKLPMT